MSIKKAIQKLTLEIVEKQMTIEALERFDELNFHDQLMAIRESSLRYDIKFRKVWIQKVLNYKDYTHIGGDSNGIIIYYKNHTVYIPTHNSDMVIVEEIEKIEEPIIPNEKFKKILKERVGATEEYINKHSYLNFKKVVKLGSTGMNPFLYWWNRTEATKKIEMINFRGRADLNYIESGWIKYDKVIENNKRIKEEREIFEKNLQEDFKMFEDNGLKIKREY